MTSTVGIIGGSGFYATLAATTETMTLETPFGAPSSPVSIGRVGDRRVAFLARHGVEHTLLPSEVNARANLWALKSVGVTQVLSVSAVGSLREQIAPGDVVLPTQFIDRTSGRPATFFGAGVVAHVSLADPVCDSLVTDLERAATARGSTVHRGTYVCVDGPQFSTRAESELFRSWGADVVGMTNLPEARLAREAELCYATLTLPTDYDCWRPRSEVDVVDALSVLRNNVAIAREILVAAIGGLDGAPCRCQSVLDAALITPPDRITADARRRLEPILRRRLA